MNNKTNLLIADLLRDHQRAKNEIRAIKSELISIAVDELGIDQKFSKEVDILAFMDGYLVAQGVCQSWKVS